MLQIPITLKLQYRNEVMYYLLISRHWNHQFPFGVNYIILTSVKCKSTISPVLVWYDNKYTYISIQFFEINFLVPSPRIRIFIDNRILSRLNYDILIYFLLIICVRMDNNYRHFIWILNIMSSIAGWCVFIYYIFRQN